jgi:hypothetical protein
MRDVVRCELSLHALNLMRPMIEASAKMNCPVEARTILPTMAATRAGFNRLEQELASSLAREKVGNVLDEIGTKVQYVIDIVVRNLYERTADVGSLATDRKLCDFIAGPHDNADEVRHRRRTYRSKATVYDEIMLLDPDGNVLVQIDESTPLEGSTDPPIAETLASGSYVEIFRTTDLRPGKREALIYARRMLQPETGMRRNGLFSQPIRNFYETMLASSLRDAEFVSHLLVDLLDRSLYARSGDCRCCMPQRRIN